MPASVISKPKKSDSQREYERLGRNQLSQAKGGVGDGAITCAGPNAAAQVLSILVGTSTYFSFMMNDGISRLPISTRH